MLIQAGHGVTCKNVNYPKERFICPVRTLIMRNKKYIGSTYNLPTNQINKLLIQPFRTAIITRRGEVNVVGARKPFPHPIAN